MIKKDYVKYKYEFIRDPNWCPILKPEILEDDNVEELLNQYVNNLELFTKLIDDCFDGKEIDGELFDEISLSFSSKYNPVDFDDGFDIALRTMDIDCLFDLKDYIDGFMRGEYGNTGDMPTFTVTLCSEVMIKYYDNNPKLVKRYVDLLKKLDSYFEIALSLNDNYFNGFKKMYNNLVEAKEVKRNSKIETLCENYRKETCIRARDTNCNYDR